MLGLVIVWSWTGMRVASRISGVAVGELARLEQVRDRRRYVADCSVRGGLADAEDRRQRPLGQVGAQRDERQQHSVDVGQHWRPAEPIGRASGGGDPLDVGRVHAGEGGDVGGGRAW
ncbi:MAG: hypothetical protein WCB80_28625 [Mycobacterium sp.]